MRETWYVLEDGAVVDPNEVTRDAAGMLRHRSGVPVAVGPHGPRSRSVGPAEIAAARAVDDAPKPVRGKAGRQMTAGGAAGYETR